MRSQIAIALFALAVLSGANAASADLFSPPPQAADSFTLSHQQQTIAWNDLKSEVASSAPSSFQPATSSAVPSTVTVRKVPQATARDVPALQPYDYAKVQNKLLIVNPHDMMIAEIIAG